MVLRHGKLVVEPWQRVVVGDIIKMENGQFVAVRCLATMDIKITVISF